MDPARRGVTLVPIYEVRCETEGCPLQDYVVPQFVLSWRTPLVCAECKNPVVKVPSAPAAHFHGSGWAKDGYSG